MGKGERILYIDFIKGFAILLVILGHCIQFSNSDFDHNICFRYIYSFHMPLFMCVSGYVSYKSVIRFSSITKRAKQLLIPFFIWPLVEGLCHINTFTFGIYPKIIKSPDDGGLWFLWVLFFISFMFFIFDKISKILKIKQEYIMLFSALFMVGMAKVISINEFGIGLIFWYYPFYILGFYMKKYSELIQPFIERYKILWVLLFIFTAFFWMRVGNPLFIHNTSSHFPSGLYKYLVAVFGIFASFSLFEHFIKQDNENKIINIICRVGRKTLGIYAAQFIFVDLSLSLFSSLHIYLLYVIASFIFALLCSYFITSLFEKNRITSFLLLGK